MSLDRIVYQHNEDMAQVAQWLALLPHSSRDPGFDSRLGSLSVWSLHILPVSAWVSSGFLPQSKDVQVRLISRAKLPISVTGISKVPDRAWVGLWSVQTRWAEWPPSAL